MKSSNQKKKIKFSFFFQFLLIRRSFLNLKKNYLSQNIVIGLILNTVYWTIFSLNAIGLAKKCLNEIVQSEKQKYFSTLIYFLFFSLQVNELSYRKYFDIIQCVLK